MKRVLCILEHGFEEIEAIAPVNLLRRAGVEVVMAGVSGKMLCGRSGIHIEADALLAELDTENFDALFLPGGPAVMALRNNESIGFLIKQFDSAEKLIAAICAAPLLLHDAGVLGEKRITSHFSTISELPQSSGEKVEIDAHLLTSRGAGTAIEFGLAFVALVVNQEAADEVARSVMA